MLQLQLNQLNRLSDQFDRRDIFIVGEMHGSRQNALILKAILSSLSEKRSKLAVAFEWPLSPAELADMRNYILGGPTPRRLSSFFIDSDGRFTLEHIDLLRWLRHLNTTSNTQVDIHAFDTGVTKNFSAEMAKSIKKYIEEHPKTLVVVSTGNEHAKKKATGDGTATLAALLSKEYAVCSVFLKYLSGTISVEGVPRRVTQAASQQEDPTRYFDATIEIPRSDSSAQITDLTEIQKLF